MPPLSPPLLPPLPPPPPPLPPILCPPTCVRAATRAAFFTAWTRLSPKLMRTSLPCLSLRRNARRGWRPRSQQRRALARTRCPYISGDGFRQLADVVIEEFDFAGELRAAVAAVAAGGSVASAVAPGAAAVIFCAQHVRDALLGAGLLDAAAVDIVLVAHDSDAEGPPLDAAWLRHARLRAVFTQNCAGKTAAMRCLPIGLANRHWPHGAALATLTDAVRVNAAAAGAGFAPAALVGHACFGDTQVERAPLRAVLAGFAWVSACLRAHTRCLLRRRRVRRRRHLAARQRRRRAPQLEGAAAWPPRRHAALEHRRAVARGQQQ
jgi:hypothetical protein